MTRVIARDDLTGLAAGLPPVTLETLNASAALTHRVDTKFLADSDTVVSAIAQLSQRHDLRILDVNGRRRFGYRSTYFDTEDLWTFRAHRQRRRRRIKVRIRAYRDTGLSYLEIKSKGPRNSTGKHRIRHPEQMTSDGRRYIDDIVHRIYGFAPPADLAPRLRVEYSRITFMLADLGTRVTCDLDLNWSIPDGAGLSARSDVVLLEAKTPSGTRLRLPGIPRPAERLSKYCVGVTALYPQCAGNPWLGTLRRLLDP